MTIKRRLFISNILMLVVPILLSMMVMAVMAAAVMHILGIEGGRGNSEQAYLAIAQVHNLAEEWQQHGDPEQIKSDMDAFVEEYGVLLADADFQFSTPFNSAEHYSYLFDVGILLLVAVIGIVILTNRLLTRIVIRSIITPLDALIYGVHQIQDGNLGYRIHYEGKDEFAAVCGDFNEMAQRLMDMVSTIQKNDENRRELIAGISHDLRTPLTSIKAYVEGLEQGIASTPRLQRHYLGTIKSKADDLEHIVSQLFLFSKLDIGEFPLQMELCDLDRELAAFITAVSDEYQQQGLQIALAENVRDIKVNVDKVQLRNVLTNILENSLKYGHKEQAAMNIACRAEQGQAVITLTDNGPGVPPEDLPKLFTLFYRSDKARSNTSQGSGLGLAISAKIMERLGGAITAANAAAGGLTITLTLPIIDAPIIKGDNGNEKNTDH